MPYWGLKGNRADIIAKSASDMHSLPEPMYTLSLGKHAAAAACFKDSKLKDGQILLCILESITARARTEHIIQYIVSWDYLSGSIYYTS